MVKFSLERVRIERRELPDNIIRLELPFPPSVNNLFANGSSGRFATKDYRDWQSAATGRVAAARVTRISGPVKVTLVYEEKSGRRDLDNLLKAILDLLVKQNIIDGDHRSIVREIHASWGQNVKGVEVAIERIRKVQA
jgi:crossover junction endodeoxyribonuclease RusA